VVHNSSCPSTQFWVHSPVNTLLHRPPSLFHYFTSSLGIDILTFDHILNHELKYIHIVFAMSAMNIEEDDGITPGPPLPLSPITTALSQARPMPAAISPRSLRLVSNNIFHSESIVNLQLTFLL
jgi:hypothetical protein